MSKISIVLPNLMGGGAERLAIYLANDWSFRGHQVEIILMQKQGSLIPLLSHSVKLTALNVTRIRDFILPLHRHLKLTQPDVTWVGMWPLTSVAVFSWLLAFRPGKIFLTDHIPLTLSCQYELRAPLFFLKYLLKTTYSFASGVMAVSNGVADDLRVLTGFSEDAIKVIYNPAATGATFIEPSSAMRQALWGPGYSYHILTVGSLKKQKNHTLLISAFSRICRTLNAKLTILGEGELRSNLERLISRLDLQDFVSLPGFSLYPHQWYCTADLFVLSSDWEGLPTVLIEALECGLPIVSTDCRSGPSEILDAGRYGSLVPVGDVEALSSAIVENLTMSPQRIPLINRSKDFSVSRISDQYLEYFNLPLHV
jgi:glycosyltransferase involved in cell wall biosynthesis